MLTIAKRKLQGSLEIREPDSKICLECDEHCSPIGVFTFPNGSVKCVQFVKNGESFVGRVLIGTRDAKEIGHSVFSVQMAGIGFSQRTNSIPVSVSTEAIERSLVDAESDEIVSLRAEIESLRSIVESLASGKNLARIEFPKGTPIEPGMVPIAIDSKGTFVAGHPFADVVKEVNGVKCSDGSITIDASMIEYAKGKSVAEYAAALAEAIEAEHKLTLAVMERVSALADQLNALELRVSARLDGGSM